ncbi:MAG TPA: hypothetical protein VFE11_01360, partial [Dongiaceae bacterium]|nr:hypothetical protein [Dongiaceae bacterium]
PSLVSLLQKQLVAALQDCTGRYGYDPDQTAGVAENALAPDELPWRQCAYNAVRTYAEANPSLDELYLQLINEDIAMTKAIQDGTLTRSQRRARIGELLSEIRAAEDAQNQVAGRQGRGGQNPVESSQRSDQLNRVVASIQGFN